MFFFIVLVGWTVVAFAAMVLMQRFIAAGRNELASHADREEALRLRMRNGAKAASDKPVRDEDRRAA
jgi:hypothetical protein